MYRLETVLFSNGERFPILVNVKTGIPDFYSTLWVTVELRNQSAVNTIRNKLGTIQWIMNWEKQNNLVISDLIHNKVLLTENQLESLIRHMRINVKKQKNVINTKKSVLMKGRTQFIDIYSAVSLSHQYNRLTTLSEYILFLSKVINVSNEYIEKLTKLITLIKESRPKNHKTLSIKPESELPDGLLDEFMSIANFSNPNNPFQDIGIRKRNHLMFILLKELGIRRGELLSIQIPFIDIGTAKSSITIRRTHDDKFDTRKKQAVSKTKERRLPISQNIAQLINDYIMNYRSKIPNANKHPYLFVTHRKGKTQGNPISTSSFDNVIVPTMKKIDSKFSIIHPHIFRHEWNLDFSRKVDKNNQNVNHDSSHKDFISPEKEAKMRQHLMGHTRGTNLGRKGVGATIIAELLDHTDTQNVKVYTENTADTVQYIDRVMGAEMGKLAQAFTGRIISNLNESERGYDPTSLITNDGVDTIGACGTNDFCITGYETCYLCPKFRPLVDGPHQQILNKLYKEKEERLKRTKSIDYASSKDRIILAVEYVVQACNEMKKTMEAH